VVYLFFLELVSSVNQNENIGFVPGRGQTYDMSFWIILFIFIVFIINLFFIFYNFIKKN
jgi:hypothetical protein